MPRLQVQVRAVLVSLLPLPISTKNIEEDNGSICFNEREADEFSSSSVRVMSSTVTEVETCNRTHDAESSGKNVSERCLCPCCGEIKALSQTFGPKINAIAVAASRDFVQTFKRNGIFVGEGGIFFRVCNACRNLGAAALKVAIENHPQCQSFTTKKCPSRGSEKNQPKIKLCSGANTLVFLFASPIQINPLMCPTFSKVDILQGVANRTVRLDIANLQSPEKISSSFTVGNYVEVERRKQAGVNEEGGVAEIMEAYSRRGLSLYKVRYVIDNREESDVDDSILKPWVVPAGRPTRSTQSTQQGLVKEISFYFSR